MPTPKVKASDFVTETFITVPCPRCGDPIEVFGVTTPPEEVMCENPDCGVEIKVLDE